MYCVCIVYAFNCKMIIDALVDIFFGYFIQNCKYMKFTTVGMRTI